MNKEKIKKILIYTFIVIAFAGVIGITTKEAATSPPEGKQDFQISQEVELSISQIVDL